jgi:hypothetical protein
MHLEFSSPVLLHQLLLVMESPDRRKQPALTYAVLLLARGVLSAQAAALAMWYGRRCYERSRGEQIMMIYEKTMSRQVIVGTQKQEAEDSNGVPNGNSTQANANGASNVGVEKGASN